MGVLDHTTKKNQATCSSTEWRSSFLTCKENQMSCRILHLRPDFRAPSSLSVPNVWYNSSVAELLSPECNIRTNRTPGVTLQPLRGFTYDETSGVFNRSQSFRISFFTGKYSCRKKQHYYRGWQSRTLAFVLFLLVLLWYTKLIQFYDCRIL